MADAKIITYGEPFSATTDVVPDGTDPALLVEDTAGADFLEIDTANERVILGGGGAKVGINNVDPEGQLHIVEGTESGVAPEANIDTLVVDNAAGAGIALLSGNNTAGSLVFRSENSGGSDSNTLLVQGQMTSGSNYQGKFRLMAGASASDYLDFETSGASRLRITGEGKVGINEELPALKLSVKASASNEDIVGLYGSGGATVLRLEAYDGNSGAVRVYGDGSNQHLLMGRSGSNGSVEFNIQKFDCNLNYSSVNLTNMFHIDASADKIGINTNAPAAMLDIKGGLTTALPNTFTNSGTTVTSTAHNLVKGAAVKLPTGTSSAMEVFTVASVSNANEFVVDSTPTENEGSAVTGYTDPSFLKILTGDTGTPTTALEFTNRRQLVIADSLNNVVIGDATAGESIRTADYGVLIGYKAGSDIATTANPTIVGALAGEEATGANTVYLGAQAGRYINGGGNIAIGHQAMSAGSSGSLTAIDNSVAIGKEAMKGCTGTKNAIVGAYALDSAGDADDSAALGYGALGSATGDKNVAVGYAAGATLTTGSECVFIGKGADTSDNDVNNQIAIGHGAVTDGVNKIRLGNSSIAACNIQVDWTIDSDERIKENIQDANAGLAFINALRPVSFSRVHPADWPEEIRDKRYKEGEVVVDDEGNESIVSTSSFDVETQQPIKDAFDDTSRVDGLIAQEVKAAIEALGVNFSGIDEAANGKMGIQYATLVVPLIKAVQELTARVEELENGN